MKKLLLALLLGWAASALAQSDYPNKPVRLVVSFAAGGISDVLARALAIPLSRQLGQQVIVDNKPGAGTSIAGDYIAKAAPDGYTIWLQDITTHAINVNLYSKLPYDSVRDFTFIAMVASTPLMLASKDAPPA
jgi:tripartite-type tricarboxylate transporter receptor subunit TctC